MSALAPLAEREGMAWLKDSSKFWAASMFSDA